MPKNASESITIPLQCPRMHQEFVTNQATKLTWEEREGELVDSLKLPFDGI